MAFHKIYYLSYFKKVFLHKMKSDKIILYYENIRQADSFKIYKKLDSRTFIEKYRSSFGTIHYVNIFIHLCMGNKVGVVLPRYLFLQKLLAPLKNVFYIEDGLNWTRFDTSNIPQNKWLGWRRDFKKYSKDKQNKLIKSYYSEINIRCSVDSTTVYNKKIAIILTGCNLEEQMNKIKIFLNTSNLLHDNEICFVLHPLQKNNHQKIISKYFSNYGIIESYEILKYYNKMSYTICFKSALVFDLMILNSNNEKSLWKTICLI